MSVPFQLMLTNNDDSGPTTQSQLQLIVHQDESDAEWREVCESVKRRDDARLKDYYSEIDTLLVFAGLFSAVLTAFIIDVYQDLKVNYEQDSADVLRQILAELQGQTVNNQLEFAPIASPSPIVIIVMGLWFTSLSLSLLSALFGIFMKQWYHVYEKWTAIAHSDALQGLALRKLYQYNLKTWRIPDVFTALGVLLQIALILFVIGLVAYLWTLNFIVSPIVSFWALLMIVLSLMAIILPVFFEDCPYKFPLAYALVKLRKGARGSDWRDWTDRDLPIAQRSVLCGGSEREHLAQAIAQTALLLDIDFKNFKQDLTNSLPWDGNVETVLTARSRVRELSPPSIMLLSKVATRKELFSEALEFNDETELQLLHFWRTVFEPMSQTPPAILHAVQYLGQHIFLEGSRKRCLPGLEIYYIQVLVGVMFPKCSALKSDEIPRDRLANELSRIALEVRNWSKTLANSVCDRCRAARLTLEAMAVAADCIPLDVASSTGISPITGYLPFVDALRSCISDISSDRQIYYRTFEDGLLSNSRRILSKLDKYHASFFCTRSRVFKSGRTDLPMVVTFTEIGKLVVGTDEAAAWELDLTNGHGEALAGIELPSQFTLHSARATRDGSLVCWGSMDGPLVLADRVASTTQVLRDIGQGKRSRPVAYSHDNKYMLVVSEMNTATICDASNGSVVITLEGHGKRVSFATFAPAPLPPPKSTIVNEEDPAVSSPIKESDADSSTSQSTLPSVATSSCDNTVKIWELETGTALTTFDALTAVNSVTWSHDGKLLAILTDMVVIVYKVATREATGTLKGHRKTVTGAAFSPNDELLVTSSMDETVCVWQLGKKACIAQLTGPDGDVNDVKFSQDGRFIAAAADDGVWIWDVNESAYHFPFVRSNVRKSIHDGAGKFRQAARRIMQTQLALTPFVGKLPE